MPMWRLSLKLFTTLVSLSSFLIQMEMQMEMWMELQMEFQMEPQVELPSATQMEHPTKALALNALNKPVALLHGSIPIPQRELILFFLLVQLFSHSCPGHSLPQYLPTQQRNHACSTTR
jgi:hypothetical protein